MTSMEIRVLIKVEFQSSHEVISRIFSKQVSSEFTISVSVHFIHFVFKICQTVVCNSVINQFHESFSYNHFFSISASRDDLNGNSSPNKSRIPVLRSPSYKVPKNVCFGKGQQKAFDMKHW